MSSHHIIREKQEPALLVLGMDTFSDELFGQLLEWSPTVIATYAVAEKLNAYGIKIDWILTDDEQETIQSDVKVLNLQGAPMVASAINFLLDNQYPAVNVVTDEFVLTDYLLFSTAINLVVFCADEKIYPIHSGFSKWKPANEIVRILNPPVDIKVTGLQATGNEYHETINDGFFTIHFEGQTLFITEAL
jgi:thiamine pyrophosphokinase